MTETEPSAQSAPRSPVWRPHPGPQTAFCSSPAYELLFGGAMGGGKSVAIVACALREIRHAGYRGLLLRRYEESLLESGGLVERAWQVYKGLGARPLKGGLTWIWPHGARIDLGGLATQAVLARRRPEIQYLGVDELSEFDRPIYWTTMLTRLRSAHGIQVRARAGANPGGVGAEWIKEHWGPWMYPPGHPDWDGPTAKEGQLVWHRFVKDGNGERLERCRRGDPGAISRSFVASTVESNLAIDPVAYAARLAGLDPLTRKQMLEGDFLAKPLPGIMFKRTWFTEELGTMLPSYALRIKANPVRIRYWDRAATPDPKNPDEQAATASLLLSMSWDRRLYVEHGTHDFLRPRAAKAQILAMAIEDAEEFGVGGVVTVVEQDPGSTGVGDIEDIAELLQGYAWSSHRPTGSKVERARPVSSCCEPLPGGRVGGSVVVVRASWNRPFFDDLEGFPVAKRKDFVDVLGGGYLECLARLHTMTKPEPPGPPRAPTRETAAHPGGY